jgi:hypothetical protein
MKQYESRMVRSGKNKIPTKVIFLSPNKVDSTIKRRFTMIPKVVKPRSFKYGQVKFRFTSTGLKYAYLLRHSIPPSEIRRLIKFLTKCDMYLSLNKRGTSIHRMRSRGSVFRSKSNLSGNCYGSLTTRTTCERI